LKELCLKILDSAEDRVESHKRSKSVSFRRQEQFHNESIAKFRATVNAVFFSAILIHSKLERLSRQLQSRQADPYFVCLCSTSTQWMQRTRRCCPQDEHWWQLYQW
tara:strand:+ start:416 stop:733 length:318 start_codon:yes stop_codon:yes gene_type:complete